MTAFAPPLSAAFGLVIAASLGWPYVVGYALAAGPMLGWWWVERDSGSRPDAESPRKYGGVS